MFENMETANILQHVGTGVISAVGGFIAAFMLSELRWRYKQYKVRATRSQEDTIDFSLTSFSLLDDGNYEMKIRPLEETAVQDVLPNGGMIKSVKQAAKKTTTDQPIVIIDNHVDREIIGNALIKRWNGYFADAVIGQFLGVPVVERKALMALTYERAVRSGMLRCMIVLQEDCELVSGLFEGGEINKIRLERPHHDQRLHTILSIFTQRQAEDILTEKERTVRDYFIAVRAADR